MGTRGTWGFVIDGRELLAYNHCDSYPEGLGDDVLKVARSMALDEMRTAVRALKVVGPEPQEPTAEDIAALAPWTDLSVGERSTSDWYCLTRRMQGDLAATVKSGYFLATGLDWPADSLFCEWGYVIDLDAEAFEVYRGFQTEPHSAGRFADWTPTAHHVGSYYPIGLVASYPLADLPSELPSGLDGDDD
jgi:hypothetical protein